MVQATDVTVAAVADIPADDLQTVLWTVYGKAPQPEQAAE